MTEDSTPPVRTPPTACPDNPGTDADPATGSQGEDAEGDRPPDRSVSPSAAATVDGPETTDEAADEPFGDPAADNAKLSDEPSETDGPSEFDGTDGPSASLRGPAPDGGSLPIPYVTTDLTPSQRTISPTTPTEPRLPNLPPANDMVDTGPAALAELDEVWTTELTRPMSGPVDAGFFVWDIDSGRVDCDLPVYALHGITDDQPPTMDTFLSRVPTDDLARVKESMAPLTQTCGSYQIRYRIRSGDNQLRSMEARGRVLPGPDGRPVRMVGVVMDVTALALRQDAARRRLVRRARQTQRMQELTAALAAAEDVDEVVAAAAAGFHALGAVAVAVVEVKGTVHKVRRMHGFAPDDEKPLATLCLSATNSVGTCLRDAVPVFLGETSQTAVLDPDLETAFPDGRYPAWAVLPLSVATGRERAACLVAFPVARQFTAEERTLLLATGGLFAQSLERARRREAEHRLAAALQRGMLPSRLASVPGVTVAAHYKPAVSDVAVGGDWYDTVPRPDGDLAVVIGDVMGHGEEAASLMGRLRAAVHAYVCEGHPPNRVMELTNRLLTDLNEEVEEERRLFATCCCAVISPTQRTVTLCRAGHPAPAVLVPGRDATVVDTDGGAPLGVLVPAVFPTATVPLPAGAILALTTDGALESADRDIDSGIQSFLAELSRLGNSGLGNSGLGNSGLGNPGLGNPGLGNPGLGNPGLGNLGLHNSGRGAPDGDLRALAVRLVELATPDDHHADDIAVLLARLDVGPQNP